MSHNRATHQTLKSILLLGGLIGFLSGCTGGDDSGDNPPAPHFTLSGTVSSAAGSIVDSDINDPIAPYAANDTPAQAQSIPNPVMVGGYANVAGTGNSGRSSFSGDHWDYYRVSLAAGQTITLNIADFKTGDLDLFLYYDDGDIDPENPDFWSNGTGQTESLTDLQAGDYIVEVYAHSGYTNYALVIGQGTTSAATSRLVSSDDFVPGDVIVRFKDTALTLSANQTPATRAASLGLQAKAGANGRAMLLGLGDPQSRQASFKALGITSAQKGGQAKQFRSADPDKQLKMDTLQVIKALRKRHDVLYAEPNYIRRAKLTPTDQYYDLQWHYPLINLPAAWGVWEASTGKSSVIVAVIDTGVLLDHPDLAGQFSADGGYDFIQNDTISQDGQSGIDSDPNDPGDSATGGSSFHGTHVAGTIAAATSFSGSGSGVAGVAPGAKIMPLRVLGTGGGTSYDISQAVRYAAGLSNDSGIVLTNANRADVINLSLGGGSYSQAEQVVYTAVRNAGVIIVAAAGNESTSSPSYPAAYDGVISVSAVDINKQLAPYSNFGTSIDVAAPGGDAGRDINGDGYSDGVLSTAGDDSGGGTDYVYKFEQGTSMAAPHMAGVVALMKSVYSGLTPADVDNLLGKIVEDLGTSGKDNQFGHGLIDALKAVEEAKLLANGGTIPDNPLLSVTPASLNFGSNLTSLPLSVVNGGSGTLTIEPISDDADWLTVVTTDSVDATTGLGSYQVTVDRTNLSAGTYTATITVTPSDATLPAVTVSVIQQVGGQGVASDVGFHYVLLVDTETGKASSSQWSGPPQNGEYHFRLDNVPITEGQRYVIFAGTDQNNDGIICDAGEACGVYLSRSQPKTIGAGDSHSGLNFVSGFSIGLQSQSVLTIPTGGIAIPGRQTKQVR
ncbi:MAG: S8 family serine peptidase [Gammaproteobacteria bacterium]|nr:S8 family serine peptidase [Gammaproteobacteria bacterium]